ncbi:complement C1q tumor necrosis factor-related protein 3-like [Mytilus trossulus]|uniref:complement C1q tumor necrosis factor-related protein 3-like n=1 Tax=Mytilus trossulus TaxID=6551 RepID=UPI0030069249
MLSSLVLVIIQITVSLGLLLNNVDISDLERIKQEIKTELTKEFDLKLAEFKKNVTTSLPNVQPIAFMAGLSHTIVNPTSGQHLIFDQVITNVGNAYRALHGIFTAPIAGYYLFAINMEIANIAVSHSYHVYIMVNNNEMGYIFFDGQHNYWLRRSDTIVVHLNQNDDVWLKCTRIGNVTINSNFLHQHVSGFLIARD